MSLKKKILWSVLFLIPIVGFFFWPKSPTAQEAFSSRYPVDSENNANENFFSKPDRMISTQIEVVGDLPETPEGELHLRATFDLEKDYEGAVTYRWIVPDGMEVVSGQIQESLDSVALGEPQSAEIILTNIDSQALEQLVHFEVSVLNKGVKIGSSAVFSAKPPERNSASSSSEDEEPKSKKGVHF